MKSFKILLFLFCFYLLNSCAEDAVKEKGAEEKSISSRKAIDPKF